MSKVNCKCGWQISNVVSPSHNNGWLISDLALEFEDQKDSCEIMEIAIDVWECSQCGRIAFGNHKDRGVVWYTPDEKPEQTLIDRALSHLEERE